MLTLEDLYLNYLHIGTEERINKHLKTKNSEYKEKLEKYYRTAHQFEDQLDEDMVLLYDSLTFQYLQLEETKLTHAFKEGLVIALQISQEMENRKE